MAQEVNEGGGRKKKAKVCGGHRQQNNLESSGLWREEILGHTGDDHTAVTASGCGNFATAVNGGGWD